MSSNWIDENCGIPQLARNAESEDSLACHQYRTDNTDWLSIIKIELNTVSWGVF